MTESEKAYQYFVIAVPENEEQAKAYFWARKALQPTLAQPNEWVKVMEAINNAAVAYIEGGPYDNDLPGMEFALKIDRLSRDFVRPPEEVVKDGSTTD